MITDTTNNYETPVRLVGAKVELYEGSTLADTYNQYYGIKEFSIERAGESKFFGFGICQKFNIHLIDKDRAIYISTADSFKVFLSTGENYTSSFPVFYVTETHRDENTNELSVTAYDAIYKANSIHVSNLVLTSQDETNTYTIEDYAKACANALGVGLQIAAGAAESFALSYEGGANFEGSETVREALNAIAEATQTIYYIDSNNNLVFKRLDLAGAAVLNIDKSKYITLKSGENRRLGTITHATELGDNVSVSTVVAGSTQYIRDNPFWELREDIATLLDNALLAVGGLTINQFSCEWRGNPLLEIGDKISLTTKDNNTVISYLLDDTLSYNGALSQSSKWEYSDNDTETESNPISLGDVLKQTYARVDKQQKQITLLVSGQEKNTTDIAQLKLDKDSINASVSTIVNTQTDLSGTIVDIQNGITEQNESNAKQFDTLTKKVNATMTSDEVQLAISTEIAKGTDKVTTTTGFTFNDEGLTISKSDSEMSTNIDEDGMSIFKGSEEVLTANNTGVDAQNLHATTYLIIGTNSRFEDYGSDRTGCFWIGS